MTSQVMATACLPTGKQLSILIKDGNQVIETLSLFDQETFDKAVYDGYSIHIGEVDEGTTLALSPFKFELDQKVTIECSGECGIVLGRAEYSRSANAQYHVEYKAADGRAVTSWWDEESLRPDITLQA